MTVPLRLQETISTPRLILRTIDGSDLPALMEVNGDARVTRFLPYPTWQSMEDARAWHQRMAGIQESGSALQLVVARKDSGLAIGTCLLFRYEEKSGRAELGYVLGRAHWGQGFMHEALTALIDHVFGKIGLRRLEAEIDPRNQASARVLRRLGFEQEGLLRERWLDKGAASDSALFGLLRRDWSGDRSAKDHGSGGGPHPGGKPL
jgi:RimJ/RimL family protein N-acetyltransferase